MNSIALETAEADGSTAIAGAAIRNFGVAPRRPGSVRGLVAIDLVCTFALTWLMAGHSGPATAFSDVTAWHSLLAPLVATFVTLLALGALGAYDPGSRRPGVRLRTTTHLILLACASAVVSALLSAGPGGQIDSAFLIAVAGGLSATWIGARVVASIAERRHPVRAIVIGTGTTAQDVWELSLRHRECGFEIIGFVDDDPLELPPGAPETLGRLADLPMLVSACGVERVVVAYAKVDDAQLIGTLRGLGGTVDVQVVPRLYELVQARGFELGRLSLLDAGGVPPRAAERTVKRVFDVAFAGLMLVLAAPLLAVIAIAIKLDDRGPVLFRQSRVGKNGEVFQMVKFRTMTDGSEALSRTVIEGLSVQDAVRELKHRSVEMHVTRVGAKLRRLSFDELPQLWNVIRGDMGIVGPRPMPEFEAVALDAWQAHTRQSVRPGLTGLWQVSGRSSLSWDERIQLDCVYARHWSVASDMRILARTVAVVVNGADAV